MTKELSIESFFTVLSSNEPAPGGGGAAALVGAVGSALGSMVGNLTTGKKKYADVEDEIQLLLKKSEALTSELVSLIDADAEAFKPLAKAYKLPSSTEKEITQKNRVIQELLEAAAGVPFQIARTCLEVLKITYEYALKGSRFAVSDAGCSAAFCGAAIRAAQLNVLINLKLMDDEKKRTKLTEELNMLVAEGETLENKIFNYVRGELTVG